jgi:hypothetical protein
MVVAATASRIRDVDRLHADLDGPKYMFDSNSRLGIERNEDMKKRGISSPDEAEALGLTFAAPMNPVLEKFDPYAPFRTRPFRDEEFRPTPAC